MLCENRELKNEQIIMWKRMGIGCQEWQFESSHLEVAKEQTERQNSHVIGHSEMSSRYVWCSVSRGKVRLMGARVSARYIH